MGEAAEHSALSASNAIAFPSTAGWRQHIGVSREQLTTELRPPAPLFA